MAALLFSLLFAIALGVVVVVACNVLVVMTTRRLCFNGTDTIPTNDYAVVLGTAPLRADGRPNRYFVRRIRAAAELYHAGKAKHLIVSGAKNPMGHDEPQEMCRALVKKGVPSEFVLLDGTGYRTLLSVLAAKRRFGLQNLTFVSQQFHNERAIFLARCLGMRAVGFNAEEVRGGKAPIVMMREWLSRVRAVGSVLVLGCTRSH